MEDEEFAAWLPLLQEEYAQELVRDYGMSADTARARAVVEIDGHRSPGRGYGKAAMVFAEEEARRRGLTRIALHVGARNDVARKLYRSLGFEENDVAMSKPV
jgi:histone acetyltransferase (RNA polymerase elongator complex component)